MNKTKPRHHTGAFYLQPFICQNAVQVLSKEIIIFYSGKAIAKATSYTFEVSKEEIDVSTLNSEGWKKIIGGNKAFNGSFDGLVTRGTTAADQTDYHQLFVEIATNDIPVDVAVKTSIANDVYYSGKAIITSLSQSGSAGEVITFSANYAGDGGLLRRLVEGGTNTAPSITLAGSNPYSMVVGETYVEPGYTATDPQDGDITASVTSTNNINNQAAGTYTVNYSVTDSGGLTGTASRTVQVNTATVAPVTNLTATPQSSTDMELNWTNPQ